MPDKGHWEPALAQAKPCRGSSRYGLPTRVGARDSKGRGVRETLPGNSQVFSWGRMDLFDGCAWKPSPCWFPQYLCFSLSPQWEATLQGMWRQGTTKGLAKTGFYKSSPLFPPASYLGPLGGESVIEPS